MSAILSADDLNDFISPGLACIQPVEKLPPIKEGKAKPPGSELGEAEDPEVSIESDHSTLKPAQISLADCLACSGCITSAEEVLVAQHSHEQLRSVLEKNEHIFVASISHQTRASLAHAYGRPVSDMDKLIVAFFRRLGFKYVVGTAVGRKLSMVQEAQRILREKDTNSLKGPILSSVCPGWVLYAEKTHPHVLPYMSPVKSPQQITGCILKTLSAEELAVPREKIYHVAVMPCFDKKLEAARPEADESLLGPDVDCVITAKELVSLAEAMGHLIVEISESDDKKNQKLKSEQGDMVDCDSKDDSSSLYRLCAPSRFPFAELSWANDLGSESGGWAHNYLRLAQQHFISKNPDTYQAADFSIACVGGRNSDVYEWRLTHGGSTLASAAVVNGFRNIQNLVRRLKTSKTPLVRRRRKRTEAEESAEDSADPARCDYVEIMACPGGCINGGGQISAPQPTQEKEWLTEVRAAYADINPVDLVSTPELIQRLVDASKKFEQDVSPQRLFQTQFHEVEKPTDPNAVLLGAKW